MLPTSWESKSSTSREAIRTPDGTSLVEAADWVSIPNTLAQNYANKRAAEAVTGINDTTRKEIANIVANGVANGTSYDDLAQAIKALPARLVGPRPLDEAISVAGGVAWAAVTKDLELRVMPGVFVAGEMLDWEAPTGGYLLTACWATGAWAGKAAAR